MTYAKLINGDLFYAPNPILHDGFRIGNPPAEVYLAEGYMPVVCTEQPEPQGVGWWNETWSETETSIVQGWVWHEVADEDEISEAEVMNILLGGGG